MLTEDEVKNQYDKILNQDISDTEKALRLFLFISKNQIFWDGNKRRGTWNIETKMHGRIKI